MKQKQFLFLLLTVVISRIPLLYTGFGADGDAWRVAQTSLKLWNEGVYNISRFPGFPVYEIINAPIIAIGGSLASNLATLIIFLIALFAFSQIVKLLGLRLPNLLIISFAFFPIVWKNSAITLDYIWGLCGILISFWMILKQRFLWAGIILGVAAGTRISHIAFILPFFFLFDLQYRKYWFAFAASAVGTAFLCYLPLMISSSVYQMAADYIIKLPEYSLGKRIAYFSYRLVYSIGLPGFAAIIVIFLLQKKKIPLLFKNGVLKTSIACILLTLILFALLSDEREYLLPMIPFLLIFIFSIGTKTQIIIATILLLTYSFFTIDIIEHSVKSPKPKLGIYEGFLLKEINDRHEKAIWKEKVSSLDIPDSSIIMTGVGPLLGLQNPKLQINEQMEKYLHQDCYSAKNKNEVYYVYGLNLNQLNEMRTKGFKIYYIDDSKDYLERFIGYELEKENVQSINVSPQ